LLPNINSFLIPGSTGDGWEIDTEEYRALLEFLFQRFNPKDDVNILIGLLRTKLEDTLEFLEIAVEFLRDQGFKLKMEDYENSKFKGFVICPPKGANLSQEEIKAGLETILKKGYPTVLYQLPQITENEMSPELVSDLSQTYPNLYMLKDSSGEDKVAMADEDYHDIILLRGAEEDYSMHLEQAGGNYNGFLLSTGNTFASTLKNITTLVLSGRQEEAALLSQKLSDVISQIFEIAQEIPFGNAFTNANKLVDHIMAYGEEWENYPAPRLHAGETLSKKMIKQVDEILQDSPFYPTAGYLSEQ
jgi:dihydrodipicolinate synthase/N-acetylneuraminate lyase